MKTVQGIRTKFSWWIDPTGRRVILCFSGVHDARGTWHVPPREGLHKLLTNPAGQTGGPTDPKFAGHTYTAPTCVLLWLPFLWGAGCTHQGRTTFFDVGSSGARKFLARDIAWHSVLGALRFNGLECSVHVQCTCKCFVPFVLLPPLQAKRRAPPVTNLQVTRILPQYVCFSCYHSCGVQTPRARTEKNFIREGSSGSRKF